MNFFTEIFSNQGLFLSSLIATVTALYSVTAFFILQRVKEKRISKTATQKERFTTLILKGIESKTVQDLSDVENIYLALNEESTETLAMRDELSKGLRSLLLHILYKVEEYENAIELKVLVCDWIHKNEDVSPFADLPQLEQNLLTDLTELTKLEDGSPVKNKLLDLANIIKVRNEDFQRITTVNKWTVPLSVVGMVLTITFGMIAVFK